VASDPSRTERATPKRRQKAREEGQFPRSADFDAAILLWGNFFLFLALGGTTVMVLGHNIAELFAKARPGALEEGARNALLLEVGFGLAKTLLPFLGLSLLLALGTGLMQRGFFFSTKPLEPKFDKLNPAEGFKRLFSARSMVELLKSVLKLVILGWVAYSVVAPRMPRLLATLAVPLPQAMAFFRETLTVLYRNLLIAMLLLALADFAYQRYQFEESLKMTKEEVKEEMKESEGSPEVKRQQRALMLAAARRRMLANIAKATVVVTNPTHVAVALRYDEETNAPVCVAKGLDHLALKIREEARKHAIPTLERPELARALYKAVDLDEPIPAELYQAVAQVLAFVYRLKGVA
jgi:flagellar biosynthetic protein FlhB